LTPRAGEAGSGNTESAWIIGQRSDKDLFAGLRVDQKSGHYNRKERCQCGRPVV
jgi:hypothetical protein